MNKQLLPLLVFLALTAHLPARDAAADTVYFPADAVNPRALLPNPPAPESADAVKEIEIILQDQASRTPEQLARIKQEEHYSVYVFQNVIGSWFTNENSANLPALTTLLEHVADTAKPIVVGAKNDWNRPRPFLQNSRVYPPIERPKDSSYPSGHSIRAVLDALVLAQLMPDLSGPIMQRGYEIGDDRVLAGVHFPSDIVAGRILAKAIFDKMAATDEFKADLAEAKAEIVAARAKAQ